MAKKKNEGGFQSQAGLVRYFDTENDLAPKIGPKAVIGFAIGVSVLVVLLQHFFPL